MSEQLKVVQPFRSPGEYTCYLAGVKAAADALGYAVDSEAWGGGLPCDLTLYPKPAEAAKDIYETEADNAEIPDAAAEEDSEGAETDSESVSPA